MQYSLQHRFVFFHKMLAFTAMPVIACRSSLKRLGISKLGLYMIHWPGFITNGWSNDAFVKGLADCQQQGLAQAVGVSNFNLGRVKTAQQILKVSRNNCEIVAQFASA